MRVGKHFGQLALCLGSVAKTQRIEHPRVQTPPFAQRTADQLVVSVYAVRPKTLGTSSMAPLPLKVGGGTVTRIALVVPIVSAVRVESTHRFRCSPLHRRRRWGTTWLAAALANATRTRWSAR